MFAAFCLYYADVPQDAIPWSPGVYNMMQLCADKEIVSQPDEYVGMNGNFLFLDTDGNGNADKMLIVTALEDTSAEDEMITTVGGDWDNAVAEVKITWTDERRYITFTCPNGKKCRDKTLHDEKYLKENIEYELQFREQHYKNRKQFGREPYEEKCPRNNATTVSLFARSKPQEKPPQPENKSIVFIIGTTSHSIL